MTTVLAPEATAEVQAAAAADATAKADAVQAATAAALSSLTPSQIGTLNGAFVGAPMKLPFGWNFLGFEVWNGATTHNAGDALTYGLALYVAIAPHIGVAPDSNPAVWTLVPTFFALAGAQPQTLIRRKLRESLLPPTTRTPWRRSTRPFADPDAETLRQKMNEMLLAMRR